MTWCYPVESGQKYCATGFPMGSYVDKNGNPKDACVISREHSTKDSYYIFNHIDIDISYHSGAYEDWGKVLQTQPGGRIVCEFIVTHNTIFLVIGCIKCYIRRHQQRGQNKYRAQLNSAQRALKKDLGRARQNRLATAGTNFTKSGAQNKVDPCTR